MCAQQMLCLDYSHMQERRNISKLYMIVRGHWFHVYGLGNEYATIEGDVPTKMSLGLNKVSGCHTKPMAATFLLTW